MTTKVSPATNYVQAINDNEPDAFIAQFAHDAVVNDIGRELRGRPAIKSWGDDEIFAAQVRLEVLDIREFDGSTVITTKVDGNFDRTGLPDPLIMEHEVQMDSEQIKRLTCRLAAPQSH